MIKMLARYHKIFFFIFTVFLLFFIGILYYLSLPFKSKSVVYIPQGSVSKIIASLGKEGYQVSNIDAFVLRFLGQAQAGWIQIGEENLTRIDFLRKLTTAKAALESITLIPGETTLVFFRQLATQLNLNEDKLLSEYKKRTPYLEGMFYPETYKIPKGINEAFLVELLLSYSKNYSQQASQKIFGEFNEKKWHQYVITASIIQKEAASNEEMPLVASVIYNRLKIGMKLQMDGTLNYGLFSHTRITPERIRTDESFYNTYKFEGLPREAVCNVSLNAIRAAIFPAKTNYLYFMRDKSTGKHIFSSNLNDHNKAVEAQRGK
ncbi:endolytic transglycosylase MltG [Campylobacter troglodytis]|uniref:endolytic transglycosylase MltG n=1 Tax=Campylobacter troglodytis TaxID=654363 RepID=UPI001FE2A309|nr:endolytic transglycosylase MltG [Campylobacter troglodytis]